MSVRTEEEASREEEGSKLSAMSISAVGSKRTGDAKTHTIFYVSSIRAARIRRAGGWRFVISIRNNNNNNNITVEPITK